MPNIVLPFGEDKPSVNGRQQAWMENRGIRYSLKPLLWCLKVAGLLHSVPLSDESHSETGHDEEISPERTRSRTCSPWLVYCVFIFLILVGNFANSLTLFKNATGFNGTVCNEIITATWFLQVACFTLNNILSCKKWNGVFEQWDRLADKLGLQCEKMPRRIAVFTSVLYVFWIMAAFAFTGIGAYFISDSQNAAPPTDALSIFMKILLMVVYFYFVSAWFLLSSMFSVISFLLYVSFRRFTRKFTDSVTGVGKFNGDIEKYRLLHVDLLRLLHATDEIFSMYVLVAIATIIPLIIFTLYFVLFQNVDTFSYAATWWSVALSFIQIIFLFLGGGIVNHEAHSAVSSIYRVDLRHLTSEECLQVTTFLNQLTSSPIGFTAFGLFTIDKPTIITFAGSIVTYAVVVIQFKPSDNTLEQIQQALNCTSV